MVLILISGTSGSGKSTIIKWLLKNIKDISLSISHTTRLPRENELNGRDYHFISKGNFLKMIEGGKFYEWAEYDHNFYGTAFDELNKTKIVILDVEREGSLKFKEFKTCKIFLKNTKEVITERLLKRYNNDLEKVKKRIKYFEKDQENANSGIFDHIIITDNFDSNCKEIYKIIENFIKKSTI
ncbi:Guanylate kinase [Pseudoloma neurophilia]|uniref:Guanylate kinase n=1 Tax=Pseudoloma neurophilia TaxID=146866 RepID=A0A0R0LTF0_9MICR|nr:Guanylate kinase [Pseudoloma neurophilia]